jgi:sigma-B regulation protein RsbU (phosphoserine phosphatase)
LLGHFPEETYSVVQVPVEPGDRAVLYTDGILETTNSSDQEFGVALFRQSLERNHSLGAELLADSLLEELSRWSGHPKGENQQDDITLLAVNFNKVMND